MHAVQVEEGVHAVQRMKVTARTQECRVKGKGCEEAGAAAAEEDFGHWSLKT